jgi:acetylornithine deacetylase/succinyl-diaminopimelate desuccinylase-like protein
MLHEVDEYIPEATFLEGIGIYVNVIRDLASQGPEMP